ncbi:MAG: hypothetical protein ACEPO2_21560 [Pelagibaca sp.]
MTYSLTTGPCGLTSAQILGLAGGARRAAIDLGCTDGAQLNDIYLSAGAFFTRELSAAREGSEALCYEQRVRIVAPAALWALSTPATLEDCLETGWSQGPELNEQDSLKCALAVIRATKGLQAILGASTEDMLDLLVWVQVALQLGNDSAIASEEMPTARGTRSRRHRRVRLVRH